MTMMPPAAGAPPGPQPGPPVPGGAGPDPAALLTAWVAQASPDQIAQVLQFAMSLGAPSVGPPGPVFSR